ncbi:hypothetical protein [Paenibacillus sp. USHLN196]|uniref:hypothetical protein n=1 Tax=Paenibacillus sp. USHLN196 TaxID=3081291 RepID=UPI003018A740
MDVNEIYKQDYDNLPPDEKEAWKFDHYFRTRIAIDKYFILYGLDVAMVVAMMERAKESNIRFQTMIDLIDAKTLPPYSRELNEFESLFADLFDIVLRPLPSEIELTKKEKIIKFLKMIFWIK